MESNVDYQVCKACGFRRSKVYTYVGESRLISTGRTKLGSSMERTFEDAEGAFYELDANYKGYREVNLEYLQRLKQAYRTNVHRQKSNIKQSNLWHFVNVTCAKHPEIGRWFADLTVPRVIRDNVETLYQAVLGHIQGKRPEYVMTVLVDIVYMAHQIPFDPPHRFLKEINWEAYIKTWNDVWEVLRAKGIRSLRTPKGLIELRKRQF
ncbi:MAG: hypothetical protein RMJ15_00010 [Nitrososphaerota archaeon]|nr:hypothetical protein [Nitrososphaerota archaeon]